MWISFRMYASVGKRQDVYCYIYEVNEPGDSLRSALKGSRKMMAVINCEWMCHQIRSHLTSFYLWNTRDGTHFGSFLWRSSFPVSMIIGISGTRDDVTPSCEPLSFNLARSQNTVTASIKQRQQKSRMLKQITKSAKHMTFLLSNQRF